MQINRMTKVKLGNIFPSKKSVSNFRVKQLLMFLHGYSISQLSRMYDKYYGQSLNSHFSHKQKDQENKCNTHENNKQTLRNDRQLVQISVETVSDWADKLGNTDKMWMVQAFQNVLLFIEQNNVIGQIMQISQSEQERFFLLEIFEELLQKVIRMCKSGFMNLNSYLRESLGQIKRKHALNSISKTGITQFVKVQIAKQVTEVPKKYLQTLKSHPVYTQISFKNYHNQAQRTSIQQRQSTIKTKNVVLYKQMSSQQQGQMQSQPKFCEICCFELNTRNPQDKMQSLGVAIYRKCGHEYHLQCLSEAIKEHIFTHGDVISQNDAITQNNQRRTTQDQSHTRIRLQSIQGNQTLTLIKCPDFQACQTYLMLTEVHDILLESDKLKNTDSTEMRAGSSILPNLNKFYESAFNSYLTKNNISAFGPLKKVSEVNKLAKQQQEIDMIDQRKASSLSCFFYCRTNACNAVYQFTHKEINQSSLSLFVCRSCHQPFCLLCCSSLHPSMSCKQNEISTNYLKQDQKFEEYLKTLKKPYRKCPSCKFFVDNWRGCSTVKCRCGTEFCYKCGNTGCPHGKCLKQMQKQNKQYK